jgi:hypothetical protein
MLRLSLAAHRKVCGFFFVPGLQTYMSYSYLVLLCHKLYRLTLQQGQRASCIAIARAMSARRVGMESGTWRCVRPAAARDVTFG